MNKKKIPELAIYRLSLYLREIERIDSVDVRTLSSSEIGARTNISDVQVRKDLAYFGQFGVTGSGYAVKDLKKALIRILGKDKTWNMCIVGTGRLGEALLSYSGFAKQGISVVAAFDRDSAKIGTDINGIPVMSVVDIADIVKGKQISIGVIAVPARESQGVADILVDSGVECILNFAPKLLNVPENVKIKNVDLSRELDVFSYCLSNRGSL